MGQGECMHGGLQGRMTQGRGINAGPRAAVGCNTAVE